VTRVTVQVDSAQCVGSGQCELYCPPVFRVVDDVARVRDRHPPAELREDVEDAADACPTQAITVEIAQG
jgi:ferredoxin